MGMKKKPTFGKFILTLLVGVPTLFNLVGKIATLIGIEARLAGKSLISIIMLSVMFAIICSATWGCLLAMLFFYLTAKQWSIQLALTTLLVLNLILLSILCFSITRFKKKLLFPETRRRMRHAHHLYKDF